MVQQKNIMDKCFAETFLAAIFLQVSRDIYYHPSISVKTTESFQKSKRTAPQTANMKRKLDSNDTPSVEKTPEGDKSTDPSFEILKLDARLLQALAKEKFNKPTLVQAEAIPLALEGKDILGMLFPNCISCTVD